MDTAAEVVAEAVAEGEGLPRGQASLPPQERDDGVLAHLAQREHGAYAAEEAPLAHEVLAAAADLLRQGPIGGRRAAGGGRDVAIDQPQPIAPRHRGGLAREAGPVEGGEQEIAGAIAGEDAAGAVAAVGGGGETDDQQARRRIAPARDGTPPVLLVLEPPHLHPRHLPAPGAQARAALAGDDVARHAREAVAGRGVTDGDGVRARRGHDWRSGGEGQRRLPPAAALGARRVRASVVRAAAARLAGFAGAAAAAPAAGAGRGPCWAWLGLRASV